MVCYFKAALVVVRSVDLARSVVLIALLSFTNRIFSHMARNDKKLSSGYLFMPLRQFT